MNMQAETTEKTMIDEINEIFETHLSQRLKVQSVLVRSMLHIERHGDTGFIPYFIGKLESEDGKGFNKDAIVEWINRFTKAVVKYDAKTKKHIVTFNREKGNNIELGKTTSWWLLKDKKDMTGFDQIKAFEHVIALGSKKGAERMRLVEKGDIAAAEAIKVDSELSAAVRFLMSDHRYVEMVLEAQQRLANMPAVVNG